MQQLTRSKSEIVDGLERIGTDRYRAILNTKHIGWSGILMLTGKGPFPADLMTNTSESRSDGWPEKFLALARQREWKAEMVWYRTVDEIPEPGGN